MPRFEYQLVRLANGSHTIRSLAEAETFHPVVGPVAEAEALYVTQLKLRDRLAAHPGAFVVWDVGLGGAANVLTLLRHTADLPNELVVVSFDHTLEALRFAVEHSGALEYLDAFLPAVGDLLHHRAARFHHGGRDVTWRFVEGDFPTRLAEPGAEAWPKPDAILFDAFSPGKNPAMWTQRVFARLFNLLDPGRACALPTYSRSTLLRVSLLLAGFYVGVGGATGEKEETTIASNSLALLDRPLGRDFLGRARRSRSAEPLWEPVYRQEPLRPETWERLQNHRQFAELRG